MKPPTISVIISSYNQPDYIVEALSSVIDQQPTYHQVVVIDDCSTDTTWDIIKKIKLEHPEIEIFQNSKNIGVGLTRNVGLKKATGEYVYFLDGDDWIEPNAHCEMLKLISSDRPDFGIFGFNLISPPTQNSALKRPLIPFCIDFLNLENPTTPKERAAIQNYIPPAWVKICRKEFLESNKISFRSVYMEDIPWTYRVLLNAKEIRCTPNKLINYRIHESSTLRTSSDANWAILDIWQESADVIYNFPNVTPEEIDVFELNRFQSLVTSLLHTERLPTHLHRAFALQILPLYQAKPNLVSDTEYAELDRVREIANS